MGRADGRGLQVWGAAAGVVGGRGEKPLLTLSVNEPDSESALLDPGLCPYRSYMCPGADPAAEVPGVGSLRAGAVLGGLWAHLVSSATV